MDTPPPPLLLIAALDRARAIGRGNALPWHLPADLARFKALTLGRPVLMGRRTAQAIGRALPGRLNLVLTRAESAPFAGQRRVASLEQARMLAGADGLCVIGGGEVYELALPLASGMHLTHVETVIDDADTWFPQWQPSDWRVISEQAHPADPRHAYGFRYVDYVRCAPHADATGTAPPE